jgi:YegS/Rv2252/BmrU family lipid kinase
MKYYFIVNPAAGKFDCSDIVRQKIEEVGLPKQDVTIYYTKCEGDGQKYVSRLSRSGEEAVVFACGGDGTLYEVINGIGKNSNLILGVMPFGSGNDFVKSYSNKDTALDLKAQLEGEVVNVDLMQEADGSFAAGIASIGFDADVAMNVGVFKRLPMVSGSGAYIMSIGQRIFKKMAVPITVTLDNERVITGDYVIAVVANGKFYGGGFMAAPHADMQDGMLEVILVKKLGRPAFLKLVGLYKQGKHINGNEVAKSCEKYVEIYRCKQCSIVGPNGFTRNMDGECKTASSLEIGLIEKGLRLLVPKMSANL